MDYQEMCLCLQISTRSTGCQQNPHNAMMTLKGDRCDEMTALILLAALATLLTQVGILWILQLGEGINHPGLYLSMAGLGVLCWCFAADPSS